MPGNPPGRASPLRESLACSRPLSLGRGLCTPPRGPAILPRPFRVGLDHREREQKGTRPFRGGSSCRPVAAMLSLSWSRQGPAQPISLHPQCTGYESEQQRALGDVYVSETHTFVSTAHEMRDRRRTQRPACSDDALCPQRARRREIVSGVGGCPAPTLWPGCRLYDGQ